MRLIGHLENQAHADRVSGWLAANGIQNLVEPDEGARWAVWVHAEEDLARARELLQTFRRSPEDPRFRQGPRTPGASRGPEADPPSAKGRTRRVAGHVEIGVGMVTLLVFVGCGLVALVTRLSTDHALVARLQISEVPYRLGARWALFLPEVRSGEVWRVFTPALLHFGWAHLLFNLWTFWDLGNAIERRRGSLALLGMVVGFGIVSNLGQYLARGPAFGGLSGALYGLLGYLWMMGRYRPSAGLALHPQVVVLMLVWFALCATDALGVPVANTAHGVGLVAGVVWGRVSAAWGR